MIRQSTERLICIRYLFILIAMFSSCSLLLACKVSSVDLYVGATADEAEDDGLTSANIPVGDTAWFYAECTVTENPDSNDIIWEFDLDGDGTYESGVTTSYDDPNATASATYSADCNNITARAHLDNGFDSPGAVSNACTVLSSGCGATYEIGLFRAFWTSIDSCLPVLCDGSDDDIKTDDCGNSLEIMCAQSDGTGGPLGCAYRYFYNDNLVSSCIWEAGTNLFYYKYKEYDNGNNQYYKLKHSTLDGDCDEGCSGYCCALITKYDCGSEAVDTCWRKVDDDGGFPDFHPVLCSDGYSCPGH